MPTISDYVELDLTGLNVDHVTPRRSILQADYGHGYKDTVRVGPVGGTRQFVLSAGVWPDDEAAASINGVSWMEYYTTFFDARLDNANEPFVIEWRGRKWLVDFDEPAYGVETHTSNLFTPDGITLNLRRVPGLVLEADGSFPRPATPTGLTLEVLSDSSIFVSWDAAPDVTAPSVPDMTAATAIGGDTITWNWTAATDDTAVTGYDLQVALDSGFTTGLVTINLGAVLTYVQTGLSISTTYYARVRAHDAVPNNSAYSASVNATTTATLDSDAQAFLTASGITDPTISIAINDLVVDLKAASLWTKMLAIYPFVGGTASTNKWNLKNPLDTDAAYRLTFTGGLTHTNGLLPDGSTGYANTHFDPQTKASLDDHHLSIYSNTDNTPPGSDSVDIGAYDGGGTNVGSLSIRGTGTKDTLVGRLWSTNITSANASALGFFCVSRTSSSNTEIYKNGTSQAAGAGAGALLINATVYFIGNRNDNGSGYINGWTNQNYVFASIGTGLNDTEASDLRTAVEAFEVALGREA